MKIPKVIQQLAPLWSTRIKYEKIDDYMEMIEVKKMDDRELDIGMPVCCIVGEVWGFNERYMITCYDCEHYSMELWRGISYVKQDKFEKSLRGLARHIKEEHKWLVENKN